MGKRQRSLGVFNQQDGDEIRITDHAIERYRTRIEPMPREAALREIRRLIGHSEPVAKIGARDNRCYLACNCCVFVLTRTGVIITVLPAVAEQFERSVKALREHKKRVENIKRRQKRGRPDKP